MLTIGHPSAPPLVFLHGFLGRGADWLPIARTFAGRYYCILPDLPGHGSNITFPLGTVLNYEFLVQDLIDNLPTKRPITLVGYSLGGRTALYFALNHPERVRTLILEGTNPGLEDPIARQERTQSDDAWSDQIRTRGLPTFVDKWYNQPLFHSLHHHPTLLEQFKTTRRENDPRWMAKVISELSPGRMPWLGDRLGEIKIPTLLLAGSLDEKYASCLHDLSAKIQGSMAWKVPMAGHSIHTERPGRFNAICHAFLSKDHY